jgi:hypothetical protein
LTAASALVKRRRAPRAGAGQKGDAVGQVADKWRTLWNWQSRPCRVNVLNSISAVRDLDGDGVTEIERSLDALIASPRN